MSTCRVRASRAIARRLLKSERMICAIAEERRWWIRHLLDLAFRWRERGHCDGAMRWEAAQQERPLALFDLNVLDRLRSGL